MSLKQNKKTIKPMSLEDQIAHLEDRIKTTLSAGNNFCVIEMYAAKEILVTLKRLPKGVD